MTCCALAVGVAVVEGTSLLSLSSLSRLWVSGVSGVSIYVGTVSAIPFYGHPFCSRPCQLYFPPSIIPALGLNYKVIIISHLANLRTRICDRRRQGGKKTTQKKDPSSRLFVCGGTPTTTISFSSLPRTVSSLHQTFYLILFSFFFLSCIIYFEGTTTIVNTGRDFLLLPLLLSLV